MEYKDIVKKYFTETPELMQHQSSGSDISDTDPNEWDFVSVKFLIKKEFKPGLLFLKVKNLNSKDYKFAIQDMKTKKIITAMRATIDPFDYKIDPEEVRGEIVVTTEEFRQKGWGKQLYKLVIENEKLLISDAEFYPGTAKIWKDYIPTIANVYNLNSDNELEPFNFAKATYRNGHDYNLVASKHKLL